MSISFPRPDIALQDLDSQQSYSLWRRNIICFYSPLTRKFYKLWDFNIVCGQDYMCRKSCWAGIYSFGNDHSSICLVVLVKK